jgi:hypothetical protein
MSVAERGFVPRASDPMQTREEADVPFADLHTTQGTADHNGAVFSEWLREWPYEPRDEAPVHAVRMPIYRQTLIVRVLHFVFGARPVRRRK